MVYQLDTPGLEDQAVTTQKIDTAAVTLDRAASSLTNALVPVKGIIMFSGTAAEVPANWSLCDGTNGTPDLTNKFVISSPTYDTGQNRWETNITGTGTATGGSKDATLPSHSHTVDNHNHGNGSLSVNNYTHNHVFPGDDGLQTADGVGGWTNRTTSNWTYDADSDSGQAGGKIYRTSDSTNTPTVGGSTANANPGTDSQGSSATNANLPPYFALAFIMRVT